MSAILDMLQLQISLGTTRDLERNSVVVSRDFYEWFMRCNGNKKLMDRLQKTDKIRIINLSKAQSELITGTISITTNRMYCALNTIKDG